ncbi:Tll0287-like domain-containing protein [Mariniradius saccharolyticus]|nr:DUF3365 domain-containing protein [Mariniradius saccharolyticus]
MKKILKFLIPISMLMACGSNERVSKEVFEEATKSMEVRKISEADIVREAMKWGDEISTEAQQQLLTVLQTTISEKGVPAAIEVCHTQALPILKDVSDKYGVQIKRASFAYRNPLDKPDEAEKAILDAYTYNVENQIPNEPNIQKLENGDVLLYTKAIQIPNALCLNCHGKKGEDIKPETQAALNQIYPEDKATGHKVGDLRGMWSIRIPKKEVVKRM